MKKKLYIVCLCILCAAFFCVAAVNALRPDRPEISERENRALAKFPEFSLGSLADGSFFSGIDTFFADTFLGREFLVSVSQKIQYVKGIHFIVGADDDIIYIPVNSGNVTPEDDFEEQETVKNDTPKDNTPSENADKINENEDSVHENIPDEPSVPDNADNAEVPEKTDMLPENNSDDTFLPEDKTETPNAPDEPPENADKPDVFDNNKAPQLDESHQTVDTVQSDGEAEFTASGHIIYQNAVLSIPYLVKSVAQSYADAIASYADLFPDADVWVLEAPLSSAMVDNEKIRKKVTDQDSMINTINSYMRADIHGVNVFSRMYEHRSEYIFFRSDHHWTARGAYYAYTAFAEARGFTPADINDMEEVLLNSSWQGSMYSMTGEERVKDFRDEVYAYIPTKPHTMTVYPSRGEAYTLKTSIPQYKSYTAFIDGDNPYTIIEVPSNPSDLRILVFKDSYGNAFVPFLTEHYGTIIVVDPRYANFNVYELLKDYPITDILFLTNLYNPNVKSWVNNVNRIIGK